MPHIKDYRDLFTLENYPKGENGLSDIPYEDVIAALDETFSHYQWEPVAAGVSDGRAYFAGRLTVWDKDGSTFYVASGSADSNKIGLAGVQTLALRNAVLRGLGMAQTLMADNSYIETEPAPQPAQAAPARSFGNRGGGNGGGYNRGGGNGGFKAWDGSVVVKSETSPHRGKKYADLPLEVILEWAANGVNTAIMEKERREKSGDPQAVGASSTQNRNPFRR